MQCVSLMVTVIRHKRHNQFDTIAMAGCLHIRISRNAGIVAELEYALVQQASHHLHAQVVQLAIL